MKIKNQFRISIAIFIIILAVITASVIITEQQTAQLSSQEAIALDIQTRASNLAYLSNDYFLYQENSQLTMWQSEFSSLSNDLSKLNPSNPEQQIQLNNVKGDAQQLNSVWTDVVSYLENAPRNVSVRVLPAFQIDWSRMAVQNQALAFDAQQLSQAIRNQVDQLNLTDIILIFALLGLFGAYFLTNYLITYRNTLKSISELQAGIAVIGSGNLDYSIKADKKDEIGEVSKSFNQMAANLKTMTASKADLEGEIAERKKAEEELTATKNRLAEELAGLSKLQEISMRFVSQDKMQALLDGIVNSAIEITHADMGTMQLLNEGNTLRFVSQRGFKQSYLDFFKCINADGHTVYGEAMRSKKRVIVDDVTQSPIFVNTPALKVLLEAGVRAVQSTPLFTRSGKFLGVITTYYQTPHKPDEFDLRLLDLLVRQAADFVERVENEQKIDEYAKNLEKVVEERTKQLKDAERLAAIGTTAGMVGHDIRNPLQGIASDVYLVKSDLALMPEGEAKDSMKESLEGIEKNVEYINKIVQDLQDYAKPIKPTLQETDFERLCQEVLFKNGVPENIDAALKVEKQAKKLDADPELLKRILSNLVNNAVQAMPEGGKLAIHAYKEAGDTVIVVQDTGVGVPEEIKPKLFTPLFTTKSKGQGFGLAVVKRMTEALGGTVSFESEQGKGTKFIIRLPQKK